jgi:TRAP-type C4-dicarboxylate transport system permease small subunit
MNTQKLIAVLLIVGGALSLAYGGFSYTQATHQADIGPLHLQVTEQQRVNIPLWAGLAALVGGGLMLVGLGKR